MCGIVGVISKQNALELTVDGLRKVQYRGYDSAGVCFKNDGKLELHKSTGTIDELARILPNVSADVSIGHTRWATHGKVCPLNAHPLASNDCSWAIVHNGIIENYKFLAERLEESGAYLKTQTDSEVVAQLLGLNKFDSPIRNIEWVCKQIRGSYAFCAVQCGSDKCIYAAKNQSPLYVFCSQSLSMLASDPICFPEGDYFCLEDGEICRLNLGSAEFFDKDGKKIVKAKTSQKNTVEPFGKGDFEHFMLKEIYETPSAFKNLAETYEKLKLDISLKRVKSVKLIGCGTAYHSCLMGALYFKKFLKIEAEAIQASEFDSSLLGANVLCIFVSQSGETADTLRALEMAKKRHAKTIVMTNVAHSSLAKMASCCLPICAGPEIAVASTKAYTCQIVGLELLVMKIKGEAAFAKALKQVRQLSKTLENFYINMSSFAGEIASCEQVFLIGKGEDYVTALEGALKLKEISYINCNAYPAGELKHGVLALIEQGTPVIVVATSEKTLTKTLNSALEAKSRGAKLFLLSYAPPTSSEIGDYEMCISLPKCPRIFRSVLAIKPLQILSYLVSVSRGINPDMPRNLAKSVTVE